MNFNAAQASLPACIDRRHTQPTISHHLKAMREAGMIGSERRCTWVCYRLVPAALERRAALLSAPNS